MNGLKKSNSSKITLEWMNSVLQMTQGGFVNCEFSRGVSEQGEINKKLEDTAIVFGFHIGTRDSVQNVEWEVMRTRKC